MINTLRSSLAIFTLSLVTHAQQEVLLKGEIEDVPGQPGTFVLDFTSVTLTSSTLNLDAFEDQDVEITGTWNGSTASPVVDVSAVSPGAETFEIGEPLRIGRESYLGVLGTPGQVGVGFLALGESFLPAPTGEVIHVNPGLIGLILAGTIPGDGELELEFVIPDEPMLVGLEIFAQGGVVTLGTLGLSNPYADTISF